MISGQTPNQRLSEALKNAARAWEKNDTAELKKNLSAAFALLLTEEIIDAQINNWDLYHVFLIGNLDLVQKFLGFPAVAYNLAKNGKMPLTPDEMPKAAVYDMQGPTLVGEYSQIDVDVITASAVNGNPDMLEILVARLPEGGEYRFPALVGNIANFRNAPLRKAASLGHLGFVKRLLARSNGIYEFPRVVGYINALNNNALIEAATHGHLEMVKLLLTYPRVVAEIAANQNQAFRGAAVNGHLAIVELLLSKLPSGEYAYPEVIKNIAAVKNYALRMAVYEGRFEVVERLLARLPTGEYEFPAVVEKINTEVLVKAITRNRLHLVKRLLAKLPTGQYEFSRVLEDINAITQALKEASTQYNFKIIQYFFTECPELQKEFLAWPLSLQYRTVWELSRLKQSNQVLSDSLQSFFGIEHLVSLIAQYFDEDIRSENDLCLPPDNEMEESIAQFILDHGLLFSTMSLSSPSDAVDCLPFKGSNLEKKGKRSGRFKTS